MSEERNMEESPKAIDQGFEAAVLKTILEDAIRSSKMPMIESVGGRRLLLVAPDWYEKGSIFRNSEDANGLKVFVESGDHLRTGEVVVLTELLNQAAEAEARKLIAAANRAVHGEVEDN